MKHPNYPLNSWVGYLNHIKQSLSRPLEEHEIKLALQRYIHSVKVEETIKELRK